MTTPNDFDVGFTSVPLQNSTAPKMVIQRHTAVISPVSH